MKNTNKDMEFLHEIAKKISVRSEQGPPILQEEVMDVFKDTLEGMTDVRIVEMPIFMPVFIEKEGDSFIAQCQAYRLCKGKGINEEGAIQKLKEDIDLYNQTVIETEKKMRIEKIVNNIFPKDLF